MRLGLPISLGKNSCYFQLGQVMSYAICEQQAQISLRIRAVWSAPLLFAA